jgi:FG-GAP repeat/Secretion system C-terminal sorting domain/FG-GAP-like repeat
MEMYKLYTLAAAVAVLPISQNFQAINSNKISVGFNYKGDWVSSVKNSILLNKFSKKDTETKWDANWEQEAKENIRKSEYHFKWDEKIKAYRTPNRKNNLSFAYTGKGFSVEPRTTKIPVDPNNPALRPGEIKYKIIPGWRVSFILDKKQIGKGTWRINDNKAEYKTGNITVQYINSDDGMRQNFILNAPSSAKPVQQINFCVQTKLKTKLTGNQLQFFYNKKNVLNYQDLNVWDANGKLLQAAFKKTNRNNYCIKVNTAEAVYPITIDPLSTTPAINLESNQANAQFGNSVASAGDVNGDGYSDVIIGAYLFDNGQTEEGAAFVFHGSATGISAVIQSQLERNQANAQFGNSVASAGDVNGDGYSDVIVGANLFTNGQTNEGAVFIYLGSPVGINTVAQAQIESNQTGAQLGWSVACAGDVNGDGYSDIITGAYFFDNGQTDEGAAFIYHGGATGINTTLQTQLESNQTGAQMGYSVASAGNVNGDGYSDVIVGANYFANGQSFEGVAFVYHGSAVGINATIQAQLESNQTSAYMGGSVSSAGDVNGDGYSDVIVGAFQYDNGNLEEGAVFIYHGSALGINATVQRQLEGNQDVALFGTSVACAGDVNGDGYSDVIIGAQLFDNGQTDEGAAFVYFGSNTGVGTTIQAQLEINQANARMGWAVSSAGDVNGDGYSDIISGAYFYDNGQTDEGGSFVYHGGADGVNPVASALLEIDQAFAIFGNSASAGDVNGDGYGDILVGAGNYDNGEINEGGIFIYYGSASGINTTPAAIIESNQAGASMGNSVASAGDVNGDGYSDIVAGAFNYDNGETDEGRVYVFHGSAAGINTTPAVIIESNQAGASMGNSVASAGDVNGDGYSDIVAGAFNYDNGETDEGRVYVFHGSAAGINSTPAVTMESNQALANMGYSVASGGDVNGDGYSDIVAGAFNYDNGETNEGRVYVFHGSAAGINATPAVTMESDLIGAGMGNSVASAGDVNGDGYGDIVVGAYSYDNGETNEGRVYVFHGSAAGINSTPAVTMESDFTNAYLGTSVASAGDVNGDGYSDIIAGANSLTNPQPQEGAFYIYHGSATGIITTPATYVEGNDLTATLGSYVASAGDINGDGYSDVIVGAPNIDHGQSFEGVAYLYSGNNSGNNKRNNLLLYNTDLITFINSSNFTSGNCGIGLFAKSFLGKAKGKLVWETRINYHVYSGYPTYPITNSTFSTAEQTVYTDLGLGGTELKNIINKLGAVGRYTKVRARVKYDVTTAITGQIYGPWRYVSNIIDGNKLGALPLQLISFKAGWIEKGKTALLEFTTNKELGVCCFDIEKSSDGFTFRTIATLPAKNTGLLQSYRFIDNDAAGKNQFYRLKIKGTDGKTEFSSTQLLKDNALTEVFLYPNPVADYLQLQVNSGYYNIDAKIVNTAGQTVNQFTKLGVSGRAVKISVSTLPAGSYWLYLQSGNHKQALQFIKK